MGIEKEKENDRDTGRFVVSAKIVTYSDIIDTQFIITDAKLAGLFKKNLKAYNSISVHGHIEVTHQVEEVTEEEVSQILSWGEANTMTAVTAPTKTEMIITGATPSSIDQTTYTEKNVSEAVKKIRASQTAEKNFSGSTGVNVDADDWNTDDDDLSGDEPW